MANTVTTDTTDSKDNILTLIAQYLFQQNHSDIAKQITNLPQFNYDDKLYLEVKDELIQLLNPSVQLIPVDELIDLIFSRFNNNYFFQKLSTNEIINLKEKFKISILTFSFLEELLINKNPNLSLKILKLLPDNTDISIRQNLSSLLLKNDLPNVFLNSIHWNNSINTIIDSRNLLIENLFLSIPNINYIYPNGLASLIKDALNYQQLSIPNFKNLSLNNLSLNENLLLNENNLPINLKFNLTFHSNQVWFIKYSPNGKYLATGSKDTKIMIYDVIENYKLKCIFQLHTEAITYLSWNESSTELLSLSFDQTLRIWSIKEQKCIKEFDNKKLLINQSRLSVAKFLPNYEVNNQILVASNDGKLFIISVDKDSEKIEVNSSLYSNSIVNPQIKDFIIQNNLIYSITLLNELLIFTIPDLKLVYKMQFSQIPIAISNVSKSFPGINSNFLNNASSSSSNSFILINLKPNSLVLINTSGFSNLNKTNDINNDSDNDSSDSNSFSYLNDKLPFIESFFYLPSSNDNNYIVRGCAGGNFNPESSNLNNISNSGIVISGGKSGEIWIWGHEGNIIGCLNKHSSLVNCIDWKGDGYCDNNDNIEWASGSDDGKVCIWGFK